MSKREGITGSKSCPGRFVEDVPIWSAQLTLGPRRIQVKRTRLYWRFYGTGGKDRVLCTDRASLNEERVRRGGGGAGRSAPPLCPGNVVEAENSLFTLAEEVFEATVHRILHYQVEWPSWGREKERERREGKGIKGWMERGREGGRKGDV